MISTADHNKQRVVADNRTELQDVAARALLQIRSRPAERAMLSDGLLVKDGYVRRDFDYSRA